MMDCYLMFCLLWLSGFDLICLLFTLIDSLLIGSVTRCRAFLWVWPLCFCQDRSKKTKRNGNGVRLGDSLQSWACGVGFCFLVWLFSEQFWPNMIIRVLKPVIVIVFLGSEGCLCYIVCRVVLVSDSSWASSLGREQVWSQETLTWGNIIARIPTVSVFLLWIQFL